MSLLHTNNCDLLLGKFELSDEERKVIENLELQKRPQIVVYNNIVHQARDVQFFSNNVESYKYSGREMKSEKLPKELSDIMERVNLRFDEHFNGILVNRYNNGEEYIGKHSDNEKELGKSGVISISVGATRKFRIREKYTGKHVLDVDVKDGDILWMKGEFQKYFTHEIPKQKKVKESRTSLTFRYHKN